MSEEEVELLIHGKEDSQVGKDFFCFVIDIRSSKITPLPPPRDQLSSSEQHEGKRLVEEDYLGNLYKKFGQAVFKFNPTVPIFFISVCHWGLKIFKVGADSAHPPAGGNRFECDLAPT